MTLLGSNFSAAFAEVILMMNAIVLSVVLAVAFYDQIADACARARHQLSVMLAFLIAHLGPRH